MRSYSPLNVQTAPISRSRGTSAMNDSATARSQTLPREPAPFVRSRSAPAPHDARAASQEQRAPNDRMLRSVYERLPALPSLPAHPGQHIGHHAVMTAGWATAGATSYAFATIGGAMGRVVGLEHAGQVIGTGIAYPFGKQINSYAQALADNWFPGGQWGSNAPARQPAVQDPALMV